MFSDEQYLDNAYCQRGEEERGHHRSNTIDQATPMQSVLSNIPKRQSEDDAIYSKKNPQDPQCTVLASSGLEAGGLHVELGIVIIGWTECQHCVT